MKRFAIISVCLLLICGAMFYFISLPHNLSDTTAKNGVLDLTGEDFSRTLFPLRGEWAFYFGQLLAPERFADGARADDTLIDVPMSWSDAGFSLTGFATYRLILKTDVPELLLYMPEINENAVMYIDGLPVFEAGRVGNTAQDSAPGLRNAFVRVRPQNGAVEIVLWVSNYQWMYAGLTQSILVGETDVLEPYILSRLSFLAIFIGALLMMGIYHLLLFINRRKDLVYLYFSLLCLIAAARFYLETNAFAELFSAKGLGSALYYGYTSAIVLFCGMLALFTHSALGLPGGVRHRIMYGVMILGPLLAPLICPFTALGPFYVLISLIPSVVSCFRAIRMKTIRRNSYSALCLIAVLVFAIWGPLTKVVLSDAYFASGVAANLFLILSQCVMLSVNYAHARRKQEELTAETDFYHRMAHDLLSPLTVVSTNIQVAHHRPEEADALLAESQVEIMTMAGMINDVLEGKESGPDA